MSWRLVALFGVGLALLSTRACETYAVPYQTFPAVDWLEAHPPLVESMSIPPAVALAQGFAPLLPNLGVGGGVEPFTPAFRPRGIFVRSVSGVREGVTMVKETPDDAPDQDRTSVRLTVIVFHRAVRAGAWADLRATQLDLARPTAGEARNFRTTGPSAPEAVWIVPPDSVATGPGRATLVAHRGPVAFEINVTSRRGLGYEPDDLPELSARAEQLALRAAREWSAWLTAQPYARGW